jgi:hypothetical protein
LHYASIFGLHNRLSSRRAGRSAWLRKQNDRDRPEAKQNRDYEAKFEEG